MATQTVPYTGISVKRILSNEGVDPFQSVTWENRKARIDDVSGDIVLRRVTSPTAEQRTLFQQLGVPLRESLSFDHECSADFAIA